MHRVSLSRIDEHKCPTYAEFPRKLYGVTVLIAKKEMKRCEAAGFKITK